MKKIFAFALAAFSTVSMFAAIDSQLTLYLDKGDKEVEARIAAGDTYSPFNAGASASFAPMYDNPSNIGMYVQYEGGNFMELNAPQLINVPLVIVTSREAAATQNYELFAEVGANHSVPVYLTDLRPDGGGSPVTIELNNLTDYTFTLKNELAFVAGTNSVIADRFVINYDATAFVTSLTTNAYGWATFSYDANLQPALPAGLKIYTGVFDGDHTLNLNEVNYVKANEGVVVYGAPNTTYYFAAGGSGAYGTNNLKPSSAYTVGDQNVYILKGEELLEYVGTTPLAANKAYLQLPAAAPAPASKRIRMVINQTTGVENVEAAPAKAEKFVENGEILIRRGNEVYNLQGQIVK